jgi:predicted nucleic acid-binding Zn ribbon protein
MSQSPTTLNKTLWKVIDSYGLRDEMINRFIHQSWKELLGPTLAENAEYQSYQNSTLVIKVVHATWQKEFKLLEKEIISKINIYLGSNQVTNLQIISPTYGDNKTKKPGRGKKSKKQEL